MKYCSAPYIMTTRCNDCGNTTVLSYPCAVMAKEWHKCRVCQSKDYEEYYEDLDDNND